MEAWLAEILAPCYIQPDTHSAASAGLITLETSWMQQTSLALRLAVLLADHPNERKMDNVILVFNGPRDMLHCEQELFNSNLTCVNDVKIGCRQHQILLN